MVLYQHVYLDLSFLWYVLRCVLRADKEGGMLEQCLWTLLQLLPYPLATLEWSYWWPSPCCSVLSMIWLFPCVSQGQVAFIQYTIWACVKSIVAHDFLISHQDLVTLSLSSSLFLPVAPFLPLSGRERERVRVVKLLLWFCFCGTTVHCSLSHREHGTLGLFVDLVSCVLLGYW